jgi:hypothetical protein
VKDSLRVAVIALLLLSAIVGGSVSAVGLGPYALTAHEAYVMRYVAHFALEFGALLAILLAALIILAHGLIDARDTIVLTWKKRGQESEKLGSH